MADSEQSQERARNEQGEREEVADVVARYEAAFNANDAKGMNALFTRDAIFVNIDGNLVFGAEPLYRAQAFVFDGPLRDVYVRYTVEIIVFLHPDIAVAHARQRPANADGSLKRVGATNKESIVVFVMSRTTTGWRIRVGQNTRVA